MIDQRLDATTESALVLGLVCAGEARTARAQADRVGAMLTGPDQATAGGQPLNSRAVRGPMRSRW